MTKTNLEFGISVIVICPSTWLRVVSPSTLLRTVSLSNGLSNHLLFEICDLEFFVTSPDCLKRGNKCSLKPGLLAPDSLLYS